MRKEGCSYAAIAKELNVNENTVKTFCRRNGLTGAVAEMPSPDFQNAAEKPCQCCGKPVIQYPGRKEKKFCSDACRNRWWNSHLNEVRRKAMYEYRCPHCGRAFCTYGNRNRKYCSHECYIADRFGMLMTAEEFERERRYQTIMHFVRRMLMEGLISEEEYCQIDTKNREKLRPKTGDLLSGKFLLYASDRANMKPGKEA